MPVFVPVASMVGSAALVAGTVRWCARRCRRAQEQAARTQAAASAADRRARRFAGLLQLAPVGMLESDTSGAVIECNARWMAISGLTEAETVGTGWQRVIHPDDVATVRAQWHERTALGKPFGLSCRLRPVDGQTRWIQTNSEPLSRDGEVCGFLTAITDVTALDLAQRRFQLVLESAPDAIVGIGADGRIRLVNAQAERLFRRDRAGLLGLAVERLFTACPSRLTQRRWDTAENRIDSDDHSIEAMAISADGQEVPVEVSCAAVADVDGPLVIAAVRNIAERKEAERVVAEALEVAERAASSRQSFLANMSHEIRTPLNAVIGMTSLLLDGDLDECQRDFVATLRTSGEHLLAIINDILDYAKIDAGRIELEELPFDLGSWLSQSVDMLAAQARERGLLLLYDLDPDVPDTVLGDQGRLRQILINLLSNAVKFTEHGHVCVRIGVDRDGPAPRLSMAVHDSGVGVEPERIADLFEPFTQADSTTTRVYGGTGLGLAISRRLAEAMGGDLLMESSPGVGTTVTVTFEVGTADSAAAGGPGAGGDPAALAGQRLLLVDAVPARAQLLRSWAERLGLVVRQADAVAGTDDVDVLVVDHGHGDAACEGADPNRAPAPAVPTVVLGGPAMPVPNPPGGAGPTVLGTPIGADRFRTALLNAMGLTSAAIAGVEAGPAEVPVPGAGPWSVLVVEDVAVNQKVARHLLERLGCRTDVAASGLEALELLERRDYALVLMDVQMPCMDGLETTRIIRQRWPDRGVRIVAMTANVGAEDTMGCYAAGMDGFLGKPVDLEALREVLRTLTPRVPAARTPATAPDPGQPAGGRGLGPAAGDPPMGPPVLDEDMLRGLIENIGTAGTQAVQQMFLDSLAPAMAEVEDCCRTRDRVALARAAHAMKGSARSVGVLRLGNLLEQVELAAVQAPWPSLVATAARIRPECDRARAELHRMLAAARAD